MPAYLNGRPDASERVSLPFRVVEQAVMARMETSWNWEARRHFNGDPVPEIHAEFAQLRPENDVPLWQVVEEKRPAWSYCAHALSNPLFAPCEILVLGFEIIAVHAVFFSQVKRWIGEDGVDDSILDEWQTGPAIAGA